jgi:hypothetical protein
MEVNGGVSLVDEAGAAHASVAWRLASPRESSVDLRLPLADLATGPYQLRVMASDGAHRAWRSIGVRVEQKSSGARISSPTRGDRGPQ